MMRFSHTPEAAPAIVRTCHRSKTRARSRSLSKTARLRDESTEIKGLRATQRQSFNGLSWALPPSGGFVVAFQIGKEALVGG